MANATRHVIPNPKGGWSVRQSGAARATRTFATQDAALRFAKRVARQEHADLYIHRRDGTIREVESYGADPFPRKRAH
ncbi:MAG: DUF2188 domain-containing protein [Variibacter sp.]|nr:DUF2188 domain-containing protein [Variibacter sp.]